MSESKCYDGLSDNQLDELHRVSEQFEQRLRKNESPTIEDHLEMASADVRDALFSDLLEVEIEFQRDAGFRPTEKEYQIRFPGRERIIKLVFATVASRSSLIEQATQEIVTGDGPKEDDRIHDLEKTSDSGGVSPGKRIGPYKLLQPIGEGGMGSVWMAEQSKPVRRTVAIKIIKAGMDTREVIARFEAERQALALMNHPNIAKVLDAGETNQGRPFFVMELVNGTPITKFCDSLHLDAEQRLKLFNSVCRAVQHAHQKGIIHRDIKPSNILVAEHDGESVVKVIDFGLAKATGQSLTDKTMFTALGQMVGTPTYMSPEQADSGMDVDTRTDVFSLGVLLYELMTGDTPIDYKQIQSAGFAEIQRMIREDTPPVMSHRLSSHGQNSKTIATNRATDSRRLTQILRGDLDLIVMKALEKDRNRRYESPSNFAADVERFINNEAIEARPPSASYRLKKLIRRNKTAVLTSLVVTVALVAGSVISVWQAVRATNARDAEIRQREITDDALDAEKTANQIAKKRLGQLEKVNVLFASIFRDLDPREEENGGLPLRAQIGKRLDEASNMLDDDVVGDPLMVADLQLTLAITQLDLSQFEKARLLAKKAMKTREIELGPDHRETLEAVQVLGRALSSLGRFSEAISLFELVFEKRKTLLGTNHVDTLQSQSILASTLGSAGQRKKGLELQNVAFKKIQQIQGRSHQQTIDCLNRLAKQTWAYSENSEIAEKLWEDLWNRRREQFGERHYKSLGAGNSLALARMDRGDYDQATEFFEEAIQILLEKVGANHHFTIRMTGNLSLCYMDAGRVTEGLTLLEETVQRLTDLLGDDNVTTMAYLNLLAYSYEQNDQLDKAIEGHRKTLALREKNLGANHQDTLTSLSNLGWCLRRNGQYTESINCYRKAITFYKSSVGEEHTSTIGCMNNFGWSLVQGKEFAEAATVLKKCRDVQLEKYPDAWKTFRTRYLLGSALLGLEQYNEAETELLAGFQGMKSRESKMPDASKVHIVETIEALIDLYVAWKTDGDNAELEKWKALLDQEKSKN